MHAWLGGVRCEFRSFFANLSCMFLADGRHVSGESVGSCVCVQSLNKLISNIRVSFFSLPSPPLCFSLLYVYKADWKVELPPTGSDISFFFFLFNCLHAEIVFDFSLLNHFSCNCDSYEIGCMTSREWFMPSTNPWLMHTLHRLCSHKLNKAAGTLYLQCQKKKWTTIVSQLRIVKGVVITLWDHISVI